MRSVELFAGCGGLALGLSDAGFGHEAIVEWDNDSIATLLANKKRRIKHVRDWTVEHADVRTIDFSKYQGATLVSGGPPCQPFSIGGKHLGPNDPRNMWPEAIRAVREIRPKAFVFENVRGLFRPNFSEYLQYITLQLRFPDVAPKEDETWDEHLRRLTDHGRAVHGRSEYRVVSRAINAADYGAPQKRHRAIFIGIAETFGEDWNFPAPTHSQEALAWSKHVDGSYWRKHGIGVQAEPASTSEAQALKRITRGQDEPELLPWVTVRDAIEDLPCASEDEHLQGHWQHPGARAYRNHTGSNIDEPAKALKAGDHGVPGGENMLVGSNGEVRYFTVREMARLQGFPDTFHISGSWKGATRQLGNAVPTMVGKYIGRAIADILNGVRRQGIKDAA